MLNPINKNDLQELLTETKETLATDVKIVSNQPVFGSVDLWKAQKKAAYVYLYAKKVEFKLI